MNSRRKGNYPLTKMVRWLTLGVAILKLGCGEPEIVVPEVMQVVALWPDHGSTSVAPDVDVLVYFSHPVADIHAAADAVQITCKGVGSCSTADPTTCANAQVTVVTVAEQDNHLLRITPVELLSGGTCFEITVAAGVEADVEGVGPLPTDMQALFVTR